MFFTLDEDQETRLAAWVLVQDRVVTERVRALACGPIAPRSDIGGFLTYLFTPTSMGVLLRVRHGGTGDEVDLTDYASW